MIPKTIHYCWFGRGEKPKLAQKCIASWKKHCPGYEIIEWNEDNFDVNCCDYVREAYESKKYAFVADYVRLYAMYTQGGIYMDTDVEVVRPLDEFLVHQAFSGFEDEHSIPTGIMASEKGFCLFEYLLSYYNNRHFIKSDGGKDMTTNVAIITEMLMERGFKPNGFFQVVEGFALYPRDYFCPLEDSTGIMFDSENTATIHWFNKSWIPLHLQLRSKLTRPIHRLLGKDVLRRFRKNP